MKITLTTTFAIALMVFAFNTNPVMAFGGDGIWASKPQVDEVQDPDETGNERGVADSGNEASTSAASEGGTNE
ncbi:MAG: hypothetical protein OXF05_08725 [Hyphomicrobiales bacterium]|nr:hypothetical protein [Hyphomicrobiales bacterium]MCY4032542.1 hypothetical protein [Hyphomicrobiales bacterium]MCY4037945.1 hypothetical protein [Hyphomicrobiales bacterium]